MLRQSEMHPTKAMQSNMKAAILFIFLILFLDITGHDIINPVLPNLIGELIGPIMMTNLFAHFTNKSSNIYFPGVSFLLGALLMVVAGILAYRVLSKEKAGEDYVLKK